MKDVAREAGVALGTVSRVVNGLHVGEIYRQRVEDAVNKLGYQVNSYAQGMKSGKNYTVAFLLPNTVNPFLAELTNYMNIELQKRGYRMLLCTTDQNPEIEQEYMCSTIVQPVPKLAEMCVELLLQENIQCKPPLVCLPVSYAYGATTRDDDWFTENKKL